MKKLSLLTLLFPFLAHGQYIFHNTKVVPSYLDFTQMATPSNPAASHNLLYFKSDDHLYMLTSAGVETQVDAGISLTASRAVVTNGSGVLAAATTTATEIGYVNGVTSAIQTQINTKAPTAGPTFTGVATFANGSVGAPSINLGDATTGLYRLSSNALAVGTAGVKRMSFSSGEAVAINTTPVGGQILSVGGTDSSAPAVLNAVTVEATVPASGTAGASSGVLSVLSTEAAAFTSPALASFRASTGTVGAGSTVTRAIAYYGEVPTIGTNKAFLADSLTFTGTKFISQTGSEASSYGGAATYTASSASTTIGDNSRLIFKNTNSTVNNRSGISFLNSVDAVSGGLEVLNVDHDAAGSQQGTLKLYTNRDGSNNVGISIDPNGQVTMGLAGGDQLIQGVKVKMPPSSSTTVPSITFDGDETTGFHLRSGADGRLQVTVNSTMYALFDGDSSLISFTQPTTFAGSVSGDGGDAFYGFLQSQVASTTTSATAAQCGKTFVSNSADVITLPEASTVLGCRYTFVCGTADDFDINPADTTDVIGTVVSVTGTNTTTVLAPAAGDAIRCTDSTDHLI